MSALIFMGGLWAVLAGTASTLLFLPVFFVSLLYIPISCGAFEVTSLQFSPVQRFSKLRRPRPCCSESIISRFSFLLSPPDQIDSAEKQGEPYRRLLLLPKHLPVGLAIGIKAIALTLFPSGFQLRRSNLPVRPAFLQRNAQVLP